MLTLALPASAKFFWPVFDMIPLPAEVLDPSRVLIKQRWRADIY